METTQIAPEKTIAEIQAVLCRYKATSILTEFEDGKISSLGFRVNVEGQSIPFRLPCKWKAIRKILASRSQRYKQAWSKERREEIEITFEEQARRVAWRQILRWVEAQLALVDTGMVKIEEVFLPYAQTASGQTVFEQIEEKKYLLLGNS